MVGVLAYDTGNEGKHFEGVPILGTYDVFHEILEKENIHEVVIADSSIPKEKLTEFILKCESKMIGFKLVADFYGLVTHYVNVDYVSNVPLLGLKSLPLDDPWNRWVKRLFDIFTSLVCLLLLLPLFFIITLLVKLTDKGPVFYRQERVGRDGNKFFLYKFRTMITDAETKTGPVWAQAGDERVTKIGGILRRLNLDELPQFWNVLIGNMSLVGPRPERPHFVEQFREQVPHYMSRHKIKSGITGWAQIHGLRGNTSLEERIKYDLYYMENWTLLMDVEILLATFFAFRNAY
jgi:exopolysaccharide biosynthesis polyprenyl glycosylphosphotransferase